MSIKITDKTICLDYFYTKEEIKDKNIVNIKKSCRKIGVDY